jgi:hypothetical protein
MNLTKEYVRLVATKQWRVAMREYHVEFGTKAADGRFIRADEEPLLARTNGEAILIAEEVIRRALQRKPSTTALLLDERTALVKAWDLRARH